MSIYQLQLGTHIILLAKRNASVVIGPNRMNSVPCSSQKVAAHPKTLPSRLTISENQSISTPKNIENQLLTRTTI
jgi:hypothetical protein